MKKYIYILTGLLVLGGVAFTLTSTDLFKGSFKGTDGTTTTGQEAIEDSTGADTSDQTLSEAILDLEDPNLDIVSPQTSTESTFEATSPGVYGTLSPDDILSGPGSYTLPTDIFNSSAAGGAQGDANQAESAMEEAENYSDDACSETDATAAREAANNAQVAAQEAQSHADNAQDEADSAAADYNEVYQDELDLRDELTAAYEEYEDALAQYEELYDIWEDADDAHSACLAATGGSHCSDTRDARDDAQTNVESAEALLEVRLAQYEDLVDEVQAAHSDNQELKDIRDEAEDYAEQAQDYADEAAAHAQDADECADAVEASGNTGSNESAQTEETSASLVCESVELSVDSTTDDKIRFDVNVSLSESVSSNVFDTWKVNLLAFSALPSSGTLPSVRLPWTGTLEFETDGDGSFSNNNVDLDEETLEASSIYSDGSDGDEISVKVMNSEGELECEDSYTVPQGTLNKTVNESNTPDEPETSTTNTETSTETSNTNTETNTTTTDTETSTERETNTNTNNAQEELDSSYADLFQGSDCEHPFTDLAGHWGEDFIACMYETGILVGYSDGTFRPNQPITNAEAIKLIVLLSNHTESDANGLSEDISDVNLGDWYRTFYIIAQEENVVRAVEGPAYPNNYAKRGDVVLWWIRMANQQLWGWGANDIPFNDLSTGDYFTYAFIIANNKQVYTAAEGTAPVVQGYADGSSGAFNTITRAEAVALAIRMHLAYFAQ